MYFYKRNILLTLSIKSDNFEAMIKPVSHLVSFTLNLNFLNSRKAGHQMLPIENITLNYA